MNHTPGEWITESKDLGGEVPCWKVYSAKDNQEVATVGRWDGRGDEANARLIAACPMMLEALGYAAKLIKTSRRYFPKSIRNPDTFQLENVNAAIGKAISKATGK